jgi:hypothetical protein
MKVKVELFPKELYTKLLDFRQDTLIEKHESRSWKYAIEHEELKTIEVLESKVLFSYIDDENFPNIEILHAFYDPTRRFMTIFLKDVTWEEDMNPFFLAIAERILETQFYVTTIYHNCYFSHIE